MTAPLIHPSAIVDAGATLDEFTGAGAKAVDGGKGFAYALGIVKNSREDAKRRPKTRDPQETFRERDERLARERIAEICPSIAAKPPRNRNVIDITPAASQTVFGAIA